MNEKVTAPRSPTPPLSWAVRPSAASAGSGLLAGFSWHPLPQRASCATFFKGRPATALNRLSLAKNKRGSRAESPVSVSGVESPGRAVALGPQPNPAMEGTSNIRLRLLLAAPHLQR